MVSPQLGLGQLDTSSVGVDEEEVSKEKSSWREWASKLYGIRSFSVLVHLEIYV